MGSTPERAKNSPAIITNSKCQGLVASRWAVSATPKIVGEFVWGWLLVRDRLSAIAGVAESDEDGVSTNDIGLTW